MPARKPAVEERQNTSQVTAPLPSLHAAFERSSCQVMLTRTKRGNFKGGTKLIVLLFGLGQLAKVSLARVVAMSATTAPDLTERVIATLRAHEAELRQAGICRLSLFGSVVCGDARADSDVDLAAELDPGACIGLFALGALERRLADLGRPPRGPAARAGRKMAPAGQPGPGPPACLLSTIPPAAWLTSSRTPSGSSSTWRAWTVMPLQWRCSHWVLYDAVPVVQTPLWRSGMDDKAFSAILGQVGGMSEEQRAALRRLLSSPQPQATVRELLDGCDAGPPRCGHCGSDQVARWGSAHGPARFRCRACRRTFDALTGTSLARLRHRAQWLTFGAALQRACSVRKSAGNCGVAVSTALRWRHRFLAAPTASKPSQMPGIVEADETFFPSLVQGFAPLDPAVARCRATPPPRPAARRGDRQARHLAR